MRFFASCRAVSSPVSLATGHGWISHMSLAYSEIVRSLENFPLEATFSTARRFHSMLSCA